MSEGGFVDGRDENPLEAAERRARERDRAAGEANRQREASEAAEARAASDASSQLIRECLDRLARARWPGGEKISVLEDRPETVGMLRKETRWRPVYAHYEIWTAPAGVGYRTGLPTGAMLQGGWERIYLDSQVGLERNGTIWHGVASEKLIRDWKKLDPPSNQAKVDALTEVLGAILAKYLPAT